ncbi:response regulator transcription factor [Sulfobacillus harzensis]|uniref:Stage 0 sporulation protein A homolog n=1 Tax=Sulfobacillus harzensis TaxID=2729629 RepID=A0A7Y0L911_9FIRM|nr:response regulator transcription factor [Sulfobacillus harzensis]NMP24735.1 response regulator transcription factor [Sulfobacillus harzensis]
MGHPIIIGVVDDHPVVREGLRVFLDGFQDIRVGFDVGRAGEAIEALRREPCHVLLLDLLLQDDMDGAELFDRVRQEFPTVRVLVLTSSRDSETLRYLERQGASGYLDKTVNPDDLVSAIRQIFQGRRIWDQFPSSNTADMLEPLTPRELDVLSLLAEGLSNKEIGARLNIREKTVKVHISHILAKLDVYDRTQAVIAAHQRGLVRLSARP